MTILEQTEKRLRKSVRLLLKMKGEHTDNVDIIQVEGVDYIKRSICEEIIDQYAAEQPAQSAPTSEIEKAFKAGRAQSIKNTFDFDTVTEYLASLSSPT
jgi:hypothetical protein